MNNHRTPEENELIRQILCLQNQVPKCLDSNTHYMYTAMIMLLEAKLNEMRRRNLDDGTDLV